MENAVRLLDAFVEIEGRRLVVDHAGRDQESLIMHAHKLHIEERLTFTGWIETDELEGFYRSGSLFVYPTLLEGFGLPVLEAMQRGVAVACSNTSSLPEVARDAALTFDPTDTMAFTEAVKRLFDESDLRSDLIERGHAQAAKFSWKRCAQETLASYERALN